MYSPSEQSPSGSISSTSGKSPSSRISSTSDKSLSGRMSDKSPSGGDYSTSVGSPGEEARWVVSLQFRSGRELPL